MRKKTKEKKNICRPLNTRFRCKFLCDILSKSKTKQKINTNKFKNKKI